jgi:hypothetical protein
VTTAETTSKSELPAATNAGNYDTAWDVPGANTGIVSTNVVLTLVQSTTLVDAVVLSDKTSTPSSAFVTALGIVQGAGAWLPANCGGVVCDATTAASVAASMQGVGTTTTGNTVQRTGATDTNTAADWSVAASTLGN